MRLGVAESASVENRPVSNWAWVVPLVTFVVGLISGTILLWNNRQRAHDMLKTYVEIYNAPTESASCGANWRVYSGIGRSCGGVSSAISFATP